MITTEKLELPTWEEFNKKGYFLFVGVSGEEFGMEIIGTFDFCGNDYDDCIGISKTKDYDHNMLFKEVATKENYTLACRKAKELFLGEQNDNKRNH